jgi:hypothetical protein
LNAYLIKRSVIDDKGGGYQRFLGLQVSTLSEKMSESQKIPTKQGTLLKSNLKLGQGAFSVVFRGTFQLNKVTDVAIKRVEKERLENDREMTALQKLDHENVLKLLFVTEDENFRYKFRSFLINNLI